MKRKSLPCINICLLLLFVFASIKGQAQNLLDLSGWTIGEGTSGAFTMNGLITENIREWGDGPNGNRAVLWKSQPDGTATNDGGWVTQYFPINHQSMYRFTVWLKKANSTDGTSFFGCVNVSTLAGVPSANPYFWQGDLPQLNRWYLLVGYVHGSGDASTVHYGGIYDGVTGVKVLGMADYKFATTATMTYHRSFLFYDANVNDKQYFYAPRVDLVNGNEPSITGLLGLQNASTDQAYFSGKVGIKTTNPGDYDLAVNGKIRTKEVKVEAANWPDYVFEDDYKSMALPELKKFIVKHKHLPEIPSAKEVEASGANLGEMNKLLLKKVEELTLIVIDQNEQQKKQDEQIKKLHSEVADLKKKP